MLLSLFQNWQLRRYYGKTGAGSIPPEERLTQLESLALEYAGEEAVLGNFHVDIHFAQHTNF